MNPEWKKGMINYLNKHLQSAYYVQDAVPEGRHTTRNMTGKMLLWSLKVLLEEDKQFY